MRGLEELGWALVGGGLAQARKGDLRMVALASILKTHPLASNESLAQHLEMNHNRSSYLGAGQKS